MAIAFVNAGASAAGTTSVAPAQPTGTSSTDVLVAFIIDHATSGTSAAPTNWTNAGAASGAAGRLQVFWAYKSALTGTSWTFSGLTTRAQGVIVGFSGVDQTTAMDVAPSARINASGTTGSTAITPVTAKNAVIAAFASLANGATWSSEAVATNPASIAEVFDAPNSSFCSLAVAWGTQTTAGTTGASSATMSTNAANAGIIVSLRPAATVTLTGAAATSAAGTLTETGGGIVTATGAAVTSAAGTVAAGELSYYRAITIDHTKVGGSDRTNYVALVKGTYSYLATVANGGLVHSPDGYDIAFYADAGLTTKLAWEVESWNNATGDVIYWVKIPSVSHTVDTTFYIAYGGSATATDQSDTFSTWNISNGPAPLYHLNNAFSFFADSHGNNLQPARSNNSILPAPGAQIGTGALFDNTNTQNAYVLPAADPGGVLFPTAAGSPGSVSVWVSLAAYQGRILYQDGAGHDAFSLICPQTSTSPFTLDLGSASIDRVTLKTNFLLNTLYKLDFTWNASNLIAIYVNGVLDNSYVAGDSTSGGPGWSTTIGSYAFGGTPTTGNFFNGILDELRVYPAANSADFITCSYNNESSPSTFYSVGSQVPTSGTSSVTLTGAAATASAGTVTDSGAGSVTLIGAAVTLAAGIVAAAVAASVTLSGASITGTAGTVAAIGASAKTISGAATTSNAGTVTANANGSVTLTGASSPTGAGTLTLNGDGTSTLVGASVSGTAGTVTESGAASTSLTGSAVTTSAGTVTASGGTAAAVTLTGAAATSSPGTLTAVGDGAVGLSGAAVTGVAGTVTASAGSSGSVNITGADATSSAGILSAAGDADASLSGAAITGTAGTFSAAGGTSIGLVGAQIVSSPGTLTADGDATTSLTGAAAVGSAGTVTAEVGAGSVDLVGAAATSAAGSVTASAGAGVTLTGARLGTGSGGSFMFIG